MAFADLRNDFAFRRIFAGHADILRGLLNDLLERQGDQAIDHIQYLPSEQLPLVQGAKLSILDVRCTDRSGTTFVVEMQLIHHPGFVNRVVYNACRAYIGQLKSGQWYDTLADVVAISICDFELWPDAQQDKAKLPRVPMLSRWTLTERGSGHEALLQVQYAFLELPKLPAHPPGAERWAWLFVHAPELSDVPPDLPDPYREALKLANQATFTQAELDVYEKTRDEIQQVLAIANAREAIGFAKGETAGKTAAILTVLMARGITVRDEVRAHIESCQDGETLDRWLVRAAPAKSAEEVITSPSPEGP